MSPPKTTRVYLQQPLSERMVLLFPDFKICDLQLSETKSHTGQNGSGIMILCGKSMTPPDYKTAVFSPVKGGLPIYCINWHDVFDITLEAFCSSDRKPVTYMRLTVVNNNNYKLCDSVGILPRSFSNDNEMTGLDDTGYNVYNPDYKVWLNYYCGFKNGSNGEFSLRMPDGNGWQWITDGNYYRHDFCLEAGQSETHDFCMTTGTLPETINYDAERFNAVMQWEGLLADLKVEPAVDAPRVLEMYRHLAAQSMQMLARYEDSELITPRQGDIGRFVWPWEAANMLIALDRIGLQKYTGEAYRYFIERWLVRDGENKGKVMSYHQQWGNLNGSLLWGICEHLLYTKDKSEFEAFKPDLELCFDWIERERKRSVDDPASKYKNIFPVGKATDWNQLAQHWCFTDGQNVLGEFYMAKVYEYFDAPNKADIRAAYENYRDAMLAIANELYAGHENDESYILPHQLGVPFENTLDYCYYICGAPYLYWTGLLPYTGRMFEQMENYFNEHDMFRLGLAGRMVDQSNPIGDIYYTVNGEIMWIKGWLIRGETEKAEAMMQALMRYGVTSEYVVSERYTPANEWFSPWQPNASSSGRMISLLLDYYGERDI